LVLVVRVFAVFVLVADVRHRDAHRRRLARERLLRVWTRVAADWHTFTDIHVANRLHYYSPGIKHTAFEMIQFPSCEFEYLNGCNSPGDNQWATVGQGTKYPSVELSALIIISHTALKYLVSYCTVLYCTSVLQLFKEQGGPNLSDLM